MKAKARQSRRGWWLAVARSTRHTLQEFRNKNRTLQLHVMKGMSTEGSSGVKEEEDESSRVSHDGDMNTQKRSKQHRLGRARHAPGRGHPR